MEIDKRDEKQNPEYRCLFETFKSNICHQVKDMGDIAFIITILENNTIRCLYNKKWYLESLYLLAMLDYLSRLNDLPICTNYNDIRKHRLAKPVYPLSILVQAAVMNDEKIKKDARKNAIPEFMISEMLFKGFVKIKKRRNI